MSKRDALMLESLIFFLTKSREMEKYANPPSEQERVALTRDAWDYATKFRMYVERCDAAQRANRSWWRRLLQRIKGAVARPTESKPPTEASATWA